MRAAACPKHPVLALFFVSWIAFGFASPPHLYESMGTQIEATLEPRTTQNADRFVFLGGREDYGNKGTRIKLRGAHEIGSATSVVRSKTSRLPRRNTAGLSAGIAIAQPSFVPLLSASESEFGELRQSFEYSTTEDASARHNPEDDRLAGVPPVLAALVTNDSADVLATAYTPTDAYHAPEGAFDAVLRGETDTGRFVPPVAEGDHNWMSQPLPASVFSATEQKCLATGIYFEARGEEVKGQAAVAQVILNRVRNPKYPGSICGVVFQNKSWFNRCQFSFACDGIADLIVDRRAFRLAKDVAMAVSAGKIFLAEVASSTHYNATYVNPSWAPSMQRMTQIGSHIFYRTLGGGWS
ncbi:cell wall hydrolase [Hoeflea alexandrii]|uniref:cell wall hydrolase n=1 Tax=Hoeflea alexandrii TaxID=288436 RepID=UPI00226F4D9B|nr:cell wall hydrolase [Hoeflea alexandrii]MCY0154971.1 cell wall hydrolase [Hoeflea alexandrii]